MSKTRKCKSCGIDKDINDFQLVNKSQGTRRMTCRDCRSKSRKSDKSYANIKKRAAMDTNKKRVFLRRLRVFKGCIICGMKVAECLDFHHLDPNTKENHVCKMTQNFGIKRIKDEVRKCVVICSNHHRMVHAGLITL